MKKETKIILWIVSILIFVIIAYWTFMGIAISGSKYTFMTSYPAACWTDDGKQIVYLMNKNIGNEALFKIVGGYGTVKSKTYLCIMDANGKNKKVVGEVPEDLEAGSGAPWDYYWIECYSDKKVVGGGGQHGQTRHRQVVPGHSG